MRLLLKAFNFTSLNKPDASYPTLLSLTADCADIFIPPPPAPHTHTHTQYVLPSEIHQPQQCEHQAGEGQNSHDGELLDSLT